jgi:asparagine synthase (glutamine-hydrolysing)
LKDNFESVAAKKIANKLGYDWEFVEIKYKEARKFFKSSSFNKYLNYTNDGMSVPTIHSLYALDYLIKKKFINKNDIIINGNSGDFISGGHIPKKIKYLKKTSNNLKSLFEKIFDIHYLKHYTLWKSLSNKNNKKIIKKALYEQLHNNIKNKKNLTDYGILEFLEYENRQIKYVVNCQRVYDYYKLDWLLPLWNISFIKFWKDVPVKYKMNQFLYKKVLVELNFGGVWTNDYNIKPYITPQWIRLPRFFIKALFLFRNRERWYDFEKRYLAYWMNIICGLCINSYLKTIKNRNGFRHAVSWLALRMEKLNIGKSWN